MIKTNILTLEIQDKQNESTISVELTNETMHKLYRIKELHKHNSLIEYKAYADFCDEIKAKLTAFVNPIIAKNQSIYAKKPISTHKVSPEPLNEGKNTNVPKSLFKAIKATKATAMITCKMSF